MTESFSSKRVLMPLASLPSMKFRVIWKSLALTNKWPESFFWHTSRRKNDTGSLSMSWYMPIL